MITDAMRSRLEQLLRAQPTAESLINLATTMRDEGVPQITLYRLFSEYYEAAEADAPFYGAIYDALEVIWGGPWAKGRGLFPTELRSEDLT